MESPINWTSGRGIEKREVIAKYKAANSGSMKGLILSLGGGMPMGATAENIRALIRAARD